MSSEDVPDSGDGSEIERLKADLFSARKETEEYLKLVAHDLQAPLRHVSGFVQLLLSHRNFPKDEDAAKYAGYVQDSTKRMADLVSGMLEVVSAGRCETGRETVDLAEIFKEAVFRLSADLGAVQGKVEIEPTLPSLKGSRSQIRKVVHCLLDNCIRFRHPDRNLRIRIQGFNSGSRHGFRIEDNGLGVKPQQRAAVFRLFKRLHAYDKIKGSGVGLTLSRMIVERQGGRLYLEDGTLGGIAVVAGFPVPSADPVPENSGFPPAPFSIPP